MSDFDIDIDGVAGLQAALAALPEVTDRAATQAIGEWTADEESRVIAAANRVDAQARLASRSVRGRAGTITAGGSMRLGNGTAGDIFFGAEFGGGARPQTRQFRPYKPTGYWFFPTIESDEDTTLVDAASEALEAAANRWDD